jgi:hypothetical protein
MPIEPVRSRDDSSNLCVDDSLDTESADTPSPAAVSAGSPAQSSSEPSASPNPSLSGKFGAPSTWQKLPVSSAAEGCGINQDCIGTPGQAAAQGPQADEPQVGFSMTVRRFAPFESFGGGFQGDAKSRHIPAASDGSGGFSTDSNATSRTSLTIAVEGQVITQPTGHADLSRHPLLGEGRAEVKTTSTSAPTSSTDGELDAQSAASMPLTLANGHLSFVPWAPDIDSDVELTYEQKPHALEVAGTVWGDRFPNAELFLSDRSETSVMVGTFQTQAGAAGPLLELFGAGARVPASELISFHAEIPLDPDGNFAGSPLARSEYANDEQR